MNDRTPRRTGPAEQLRAVGLRVTAPRVATLDWLSGHPHSTADQVADGVRARLGSVSTQAVYDVLHACAEHGLLRRIEPAGHPARYETRTADQHHHVVCRVCGRTEDVDDVVGADPCLDLPNASGFVVDGSEVVFWGLCPACTEVKDSIDA
jgi:Fur family transcriptional regulator, stress-responsive regulator